MKKRQGLFIGLCLMGAVSMTAASPSVSPVSVSTARAELAKAASLAASAMASSQTSAVSATRTSTTEVPQAFTTTVAELMSERGNYAELKLEGSPAFPVASPCEGRAVLSTEALPAVAPAVQKAGAITGSDYVAIDHTYQGNDVAASMKLTKVEGSDTEYYLSNIYSLGEDKKLMLSINLETGKVSIPAQVVFTHDTYGDVMFCPMRFTTDENGQVTGMRYWTNRPVSGTIDEKGNISLDGWGLMFTSNDKYKDRGFNFMLGSDWKVSTIKAKGVKTTSQGSENVEYAIYIDQTGDNSARIYCLAGVNGDILLGRINPDKTITIAPQQIYNNMMFGPFFIYPTSVNNAGKLVINSAGSVTGRWVSDNEIDFGSWAIAARSLPSQYVGYTFSDMKVVGPHGVRYPAAGKLDLSGTGTDADPYLVKTYADLDNIAKLTAGGMSFEGKYVALANDLDFSTVNRENYLPIGSSERPFQGYFDGRGHTVKNFWLDGRAEMAAGFFGVLGEKSMVRNMYFTGARVYNLGDYAGVLAGATYGNIDNITLTQCAVQSNGQLAGVLVGLCTKLKVGDTRLPSKISNITVNNCTARGIGSVAGIAGQSGSDIENCRVSGTFELVGYINSTCRDVAGIAGATSYGSVKNCYVIGYVTDSYGHGMAGGIVGRNLMSEISNSFNTALVSSTMATTEDKPSVGGIAGYTYDSKITDCFNSGTVVQSRACEYTGGIVGNLSVGYSFSSSGGDSMTNVTYITNCYNFGQVISPVENPKKGLYGETFVAQSWKGEHPEDACFRNSYYDAQIQQFSESKYGRLTSYFTSGTLPEGLDASIWTSAHGKYPVLKAFSDTYASALASSPVLLHDGQTATKVKGSFEITPDERVVWAISNGESPSTDTDFLKFENGTFTVKDKYVNANIIAASNDGAGGKLYVLALVPKLFDGEGTEESPYLLKTVADWKNLDYAVGTIRQKHAGDYFAMANDIDFGLGEEFHGVGYGQGSGASFGGVLDGRNHFVHKLKIDATVIEPDKDGKPAIAHNKSKAYAGLFSVIDEGGAVKNVNISADCDLKFYSYSGAIAGTTLGDITNCRNYADVKSLYSYVGGLVGLAGLDAKVTGCYNAGTITTVMPYVGGIAGVTNSGGTLIENCQNDGDIICKPVNPEITSGARSYVGGILGYNYGAVNACVNNASVQAENNLGGIVGYNTTGEGNGKVTNCVNNGLTDCLKSTTTRGGIVGFRGKDAVISNNLYDATISINGTVENQVLAGNTAWATSEMISGNTPEGFDVSLFDFKAGSYPVLKAFANETKTEALRNLYVKFVPGQVRTNVRQSLDLSTASGTKFELKVNEDFAISGGKLTVKLPEGMKIAADTLTASLNGAEKYFALSSIPVILKGEGTAEAPYLIETPADWNKLANFMEQTKWEYSGTNFKVANDLDFKGDSIRALGVDGTSFQAVLDGNKRTIKNYVYANSNQFAGHIEGPNFYIGRWIGAAIGTLGANGELKDLTFDGKFTGNQNVAGIVGESYGKISGIVNKGTVDNTSSNCVAGILYRAKSGSVIKDCTFEGLAKAKASNVAGVVYDIEKDALVENCVNRGELVAGSGFGGVAFYNDGMMRNCHNEGKFSPQGGGLAAGVCYALYFNGSLENCYNTSDINTGSESGTIYGVTSGVETSASTSGNDAAGHVTNCYNTGNLTGKDFIYGVMGNVLPGLTVTDCYNSGDVTALSGVACGFGKETGRYSEGEAKAVIERCYNSGIVNGAKYGVSGLFYKLNNNTIIRDCYNTGDVNLLIQAKQTSPGGGGLFGTASDATIERCFNTGNIMSTNYSVGGLAGYFARCVIKNCFNLGNVTSDYQGDTGNGDAGGLAGYMSIGPNYMENCYNMGTVSANRRVGGISGGSFTADNVVNNVINTGKVICLKEDQANDGKMYKFWSGTFYNGYQERNGVSIFNGFTNVFYDSTVNPGSEFRHCPGSSKTTAELKAMKLEGEYAEGLEGYPMLKFYGEKFKTNDIARAMLLLTNANENFEFVTDPIRLIGPEDAVWTATDPATGATSSAIVIKDGIAKPVADANVTLTVTSANGMLHKDFVLVLKPSQSSNIDIDFSGKTVERVTFIDLQGRETTEPVSGQVYIVRTVYTDGTMQVTKAVVRE